MEARVEKLDLIRAPDGSVGLTVWPDKASQEAASGFMEKYRPEGEYILTLKRKFKGRSVNANRYAWALMEQIARALGSSAEEVYLDMLRDYGASETDEDGAVVVMSVADFNSQRDILRKAHVYLAPMGACFEQDYDGQWVQKTECRLLKGSSRYSTYEMSAFIDGIVYEAKELGIETMTPDEIAKMKAMWAA